MTGDSLSTSTSGGRGSSSVRYPAAMGTSPSRRHRPRQTQSQKPPRLSTISPQTGIDGSVSAAPGHDVTARATSAMTVMPQPMGTKAISSPPNGISTQETIAQGMTQNPVIGTATTFATTE